jgi:hypothetical protein
MKNNPNHGNRLRPTAAAYENKKEQAKKRYAEAQLKINPLWLHNKILRDLHNLYGTNVEISLTEFYSRAFDASKYKSMSANEGTTFLYYDKFAITITKNKTVIIWKI